MREATRWLRALLLVGTWTCTGLASAGNAKAAGSAAFDPIYRVLTHPRCLNCHTSTGFPRQGDERRPHDYRVARGTDDHGAAAMRCTACHGTSNNGLFPGAPRWSLAPLSMAWENLGPGQLCQRLKDRRQNGQRSVTQLVEHMSNDPLVSWAWAPGAQRQPIDMPKDDFVRALQAWAVEGAPCP